MKNTNVSSISQDRLFTRKQIDSLLFEVTGKTLGEVDKKGVIDEFVRTRPDKVVKGVAGDVIELSVLGCHRDAKPEPDIWVDDIRTELKTTGLVSSKDKKSEYEAKEPLTITGVSPDNLRIESFEDSRFYHKIENLLFVFYHYNPTRKVQNSGDYRDFPIVGHFFWNVSDEHLEQLRNDWLSVQEFVKKFKFTNEEERHKMSRNLMLLDCSSYKSPRFRFKRVFVSTIVDIYLHKKKYERLPERITSYSDIDRKCHEFTLIHKGKSVTQLAEEFGIVINQKDACQKLIIKMFGSNARSLNQIREISEIGLIGKTIILDVDGENTEDMKMFKVDFDEWFNPTTSFEEQEDSSVSFSEAYSFFTEHSFLFIIFEEPRPGDKIPVGECIFKGFKRYSFTEEFIKNSVKKTWNEARELVHKKELKEIKSRRGYAPNFPKSDPNLFFFRGSGCTVADRRQRLLKWGIDIKMYVQYAWVRGDYIVSQLENIPYL